jgi:hypothetical protein
LSLQNLSVVKGKPSMGSVSKLIISSIESLWSVNTSTFGCILSCTDVSVILFTSMCNFSICLFCHADLEVNFKSSKVLCIFDDCRLLYDHPKKLTDLTSPKYIWVFYAVIFLGMFSLKLRKIVLIYNSPKIWRGHRGRDHMVVWFTSTYAFSAYHHLRCEFESRSCFNLHDKTHHWKITKWRWIYCRKKGEMDATFNNISVISWRSVLLVEETGVLGEKPPNIVSSRPRN